jgi:hypothetical protein
MWPDKVYVNPRTAGDDEAQLSRPLGMKQLAAQVIVDFCTWTPTLYRTISLV